MKPLTIDLKGIVKKYGDTVALAGVHIQVAAGEKLGLIGPNGSGKSTLLKILYGEAQPTSGEAFLLGHHLKSNRRQVQERIGVVAQSDLLEEEMSLRENFLVYGGYFGISKAEIQQRSDEIVNSLRLEKDWDRPISFLTRGQKKKASLAMSLIHHPEILLLDEPTSNLDPAGRRKIWDIIQQIHTDLMTLIISSRDLDEVEKFCDRVALISKGQIVALGEPSKLIANELGSEIVEFEVGQADFAYYLTRLQEKGFACFSLGARITVLARHSMDLKEAQSLVVAQKVTQRKPNLNDVFIRLTGSDLYSDEVEEFL